MESEKKLKDRGSTRDERMVACRVDKSLSVIELKATRPSPHDSYQWALRFVRVTSYDGGQYSFA